MYICHLPEREFTHNSRLKSLPPDLTALETEVKMKEPDLADEVVPATLALPPRTINSDPNRIDQPTDSNRLVGSKFQIVTKEMNGVSKKLPTSNCAKELTGASKQVELTCLSKQVSNSSKRKLSQTG
jgi:hypothetical protein